MEFDFQVEGTNNGGSEQASSSEDGKFLVALRKMMKKEVEVMVIRTVREVIVPAIGDLVRNVVKEEIQSVEKRLFTDTTRNANETTMSIGRSLQLKFLDEVSVPVLTGKVLKGKGGNALMVALVDGATGQVVISGPGSSGKVEILVLDASSDDNEHNWSLENFNHRIIREGNKKKPHFAKNIYIYLEEGVGVLSNAKLGHDSNWMKSCKCRLGARFVESLRGITVQEARTESFMVLDSRSKLYEKHYPPSLSDKVWRLDNIGRDGAPCKRLNKENIWSVQDFLFLLSVDPKRLQQLLGAGTKMWKATVDHALTCPVDDKTVYLHYPPTAPKMGVIFDVVGGLKGVVYDYHYVPINNLSPDEMDCAHGLLLSAFNNRAKRTSFDDEASLLQQFPCRSSDIDSSTFHGCYPTEPDTGQLYNPVFGYHSQHPSCPFPDLDNFNNYDPTGPSTSSITTFDMPSNNFHFGSPGSPTTSQLYEQIPSYQFHLPDFTFAPPGGDCPPLSVTDRGADNLSETLEVETHSRKQSGARVYRLVGPVVNAKLWVLRAKKRVMALGGVHVQKKQRI